MIRCLHCDVETNNGLALCDLARRAATTYLEFIPIHFGNLARWRPGRAGSRPVPGSREPQGSFGGGVQGDRVARCLDEVGTELVNRVRRLEEDRGVDVPYAADETNTIRVACWLLGENLTSISTLDWCGELVEELRKIEARLRLLTEQVVPGWYAGACRRMAGVNDEGETVACGAPTYVVPGLTWVTCGTCGATTYARDHLEIVLDEARDWVARPMRLAEAIVALVDTEASVPRLHKRISKWGERGQIATVRRTDRDGDEVGPKRFRLGEVLDILLAEGATRAGGDVDEIAPAAS